MKLLALAALLAWSPVAAMAAPCPEEMQSDHWSMTLRVIDHAAQKGPPALAEAAVALRGGRRGDAVALLDTVAQVPTAVAIASRDADFMYAVLDAGLASWLLRGCPD